MRVGEKIWYCKRIDGESYAAPVEVVTRLGYMTVVDRSGSWNIADVGEHTERYASVVAQPYSKWAGVFSEGDLFYINGAKPSDEEDYYGQNANYSVDFVDNGNFRIRLILKRTASDYALGS